MTLAPILLCCLRACLQEGLREAHEILAQLNTLATDDPTPRGAAAVPPAAGEEEDDGSSEVGWEAG